MTLLAPVRAKLLAAAGLAWALSLACAIGWGLWQQGRAEKAHADAMRQERDNAQAVEQALRAALIESTRRVRAVEGVNREATAKLRQARDDAAAAAGAADSLREHVAQLADRAADDSCAPAQRAAAADAARMLADLQRRADERAGILAKFADAAHIAGAGCERAYDSMTTE